MSRTRFSAAIFIALVMLGPIARADQHCAYENRDGRHTYVCSSSTEMSDGTYEHQCSFNGSTSNCSGYLKPFYHNEVVLVPRPGQIVEDPGCPAPHHRLPNGSCAGMAQ